eukprot:1619861-Prymnesium_polylepis.1
MGEAMPNAQGHRASALMARPAGRQVAGRDFAHEATCLVCWQAEPPPGMVCGKSGAKAKAKAKAKAAGGLRGLKGCDLCPAAYHLGCLGLEAADVSSFGVWACPHHACATCGRKAAAAGGLLFRCMNCVRAYCEDHLPAEAAVHARCARFEALGMVHPKQACYVLCSAGCASGYAARGLH